MLTYDVRHARHEETTRSLPDASVDLILTDPPYFRVKELPWDRQWASDEAFLAWVDELAVEWRRILKPTGSLYVFASPQMAARVEVTIRARFRVLNHIVWVKSTSPSGSGRHSRADREGLRAYFPRTERAIFAEPFGSAGPRAKATADTDVRISAFATLREYIRGEVSAAGMDMRAVNIAVGSATSGGGMAAHYCGASQWELPTAEHYARLQAATEGRHFRRSYEDLRAEYDRLQADYEARRRPFDGTVETFTDVWTFQTPPYRRGRHPCEKPAELAEHVIQASSRPGDLVFDGFAGSGAFGVAAARLGRAFIGCDTDEWWAAQARRAVEAAAGVSARPAPVHKPDPLALPLQVPRRAAASVGEQLALWPA